MTVWSHINGALESYWRRNYLTGGILQGPQQTWQGLQHLEHALAMPAVAAIVLFVVGTVVLARMGETALAVALPLLWIEMFVAASLRRYPFLDQRTFHFVLVPSVGLAAVGAFGIVLEIWRRVKIVGFMVGVLIAALFGAGVVPIRQSVAFPNEDARAQTQYVAKSMRSSDVVLVNSSANWGFAYYWPRGRVRTLRSAVVANGFVAEVAGLDAVYASGRTRAAVLRALRVALDRQHRTGPRSRIFIVRSHVIRYENDAWTNAFSVLHVHPLSIPVGPEPLLLVEPADQHVHPAPKLSPNESR